MGAGLEALDNHPQVAGHALMHKQDTMDVVGHDAELHHLHSRVMQGYAVPAVPDLFS